MTNSSELAVIILAAGKGTRMKNDLPKMLHKVGGLSLVGHLFKQILALHPSRIITVVGHGAESVSAEIKNICAQTEFITQEPQLGTAHAVRMVLPALKNFQGTILVVYADHPFISKETLANLSQTIAVSGHSVGVLGFEPKDPARYGRLKVKGGVLEAIVEYKDASTEEKAITLCNSGVMAFKSDAVHTLVGAVTNDNAAKEYYLTDVIAIARAKSLSATHTLAQENEVMGINSQAELANAEAVFQQNMRARAMENGTILLAPETVYFSHDTQLASGATVHPFVVFGLGVNVHANAEIRSFSHLEGAVLEENTIIGPYARLRAGTVLKSKSRVGNFVEIKNATLHAGAKVNHLSYIGDATVGAEANIGAGTITCNYDGYTKSHTEIGEGAFVGSNSSLVAPIIIGKSSIIGAGSTVTKNVADGALMRNNMKELHFEERAKYLHSEKAAKKAKK